MSTFLTPLDHVLTNRGKVRLLRALIPLSRPVSGREAAKLARLSQTPALRALDDLVTLGVLHRMETPSQHLYEVSRTHQLVRDGLEPLFRAERERIGQVLDALRTVLGPDANRIVSAAVFGSAARGQDRPGSDFDVLVIAKQGTVDSEARQQPARRARRGPRQTNRDRADSVVLPALCGPSACWRTDRALRPQLV